MHELRIGLGAPPTLATKKFLSSIEGVQVRAPVIAGETTYAFELLFTAVVYIMYCCKGRQLASELRALGAERPPFRYVAGADSP